MENKAELPKFKSTKAQIMKLNRKTMKILPSLSKLRSYANVDFLHEHAIWLLWTMILIIWLDYAIMSYDKMKLSYSNKYLTKMHDY